MPREQIDLCGLWRFQPDPAWEGEKVGYQEGAYDDGLWREVMLPNGFDVLAPGLDAYEGAAWFRKEVPVPQEWAVAPVDPKSSAGMMASSAACRSMRW